MYIKRTKTHSTADGTPRYSCRLVESYRQGDKVLKRTLLNLGTDWAVPKDKWRAVARRVSLLLEGPMPSLFDTDPDLAAEYMAGGDAQVEQAAEDIVRRLRPAEPEAQPAELVTVKRDSVACEEVRSVGGERLVRQALAELEWAPMLARLGWRQRDALIAEALVMARALHPSSEREAHRWLRDHSAAWELLGLAGMQRPKLSKLYRIGDQLWRHRRDIQRGLFERERDLLSIPRTLLFYDLTNSHFHSSRISQLRRYGHSKQRRNDCPLVTLALALDEAGFPRYCDVLPGNVSEPDTLRKALRRLDRVSEGGKPMVVMDAGISTEDNLAWLASQGYKYLCVDRRRAPAPPDEPPELEIATASDQAVRVWRLPGQAPDDMRLLAWSEARQATDDSILEARRSRFEAAISDLHAGLSQPRRMKKYERVLEKVGRLKQKYRSVAGHYKVTVSKAKGPNAVAVQAKRHKAFHQGDNAAGCYQIRSNDVSRDAESLLRTYWRLTEVELTFRSLKSELGLRPIYHKLDHRIKAHLMITVIAYHGVHLTRRRLKDHGIHLSWQAVRWRLQGWVRSTVTMRDQQSRLLVCRMDARPGAQAINIARAAGLKVHRHQRWSLPTTD